MAMLLAMLFVRGRTAELLEWQQRQQFLMATESAVATTTTATTITTKATSSTSNLVKATSIEKQEKNALTDATSNSTTTTINSNHHLCQTNTELSTYYISSEEAQEIIIKYCKETVSSGYKPRFVPILELLLDAATVTNTSLATLQLGGMDGKTGDPFYKVSQRQRTLQKWIPIVIEPVPTNFHKLVQTYEEHRLGKKLSCPTLLNQLINYDPSHHVTPNTCSFCHFDDQSVESACHDMPDWKKTEIGSMECSRINVGGEDNMFTKCFTQSSFECGTIQQAIQRSNIQQDSRIMVLQIDVEGFETQVLQGYFSESTHRPPVINFENKILRQRKQLDELHALLKGQGYSIHEKRVDTLALLGFPEDTSVLKR
jgi:hypothetical protein